MTKRIISVLLALVLVLALAMPAMAASTITVNGYEGQTYHIWKLFDVVSVSDDGASVSYKVNAAWETFFSEGDGAKYVTLDANGLVNWNEGADAKELATDALAYATGTPGVQFVAEVPMGPVAEGATPEVDPDTETVADMEMGYYLMDTTIGSLLTLTTTATTITDKNNVTDHTKKIIEGEERVDENSVKIGENVNYEIVIHAKEKLTTLKLEDTMQDTLEYNGDIAIKVGGQPLDSKYYTVKTTEIGDKTFVVEFTKEYLDTLTGDTDIVVTYSAKLLATAEVKEPNKNTSQIVYGNNYNIVSLPQEVKTFTFDLDVKKIDGTDKTVTLAGVEFNLKKDGSVIQFNESKTGEYIANEGTNPTLKTNDKGQFNVKGLEAGTYQLVETKTLAGYNLLDAPIEVVIEADGTVKMKGEENALVPVDEVVIENLKGTKLPETGGIGTTIFYLVGGLMMAAAVVLLVAKKRTVNE